MIIMSRMQEVMKRASVLVALLVCTVVVVAFMRTKAQDGTNESANSAREHWEYLALAGPHTTNFTPTTHPKMRKEPNAAFAREAFVLEQHLDKLGANGWELVAVAGPPTDPAYYFKRRK
jgi:hypothetical protein